MITKNIAFPDAVQMEVWTDECYHARGPVSPLQVMLPWLTWAHLPSTGVGVLLCPVALSRALVPILFAMLGLAMTCFWAHPGSWLTLSRKPLESCSSVRGERGKGIGGGRERGKGRKKYGTQDMEGGGGEYVAGKCWYNWPCPLSCSSVVILLATGWGME